MIGLRAPFQMPNIERTDFRGEFATLHNVDMIAHAAPARTVTRSIPYVQNSTCAATLRAKVQAQ